MLENLVESRRRRDVKAMSGASVLATLIHACVISLAAIATVGAERVARTSLVPVPLPPARPAPPKPAMPRPPVPPGTPLVRPMTTLIIPREVLPYIPPPAPEAVFDPSNFIGLEPPGEAVSATGPVAPVPDWPVPLEVVEERPEVVPGSCLTPRYPEILRQAGLEGSVQVSFVIDTLGRVEPGTLRVLRSPHAMFEGPAREAVLGCRFRPGRLQGRAVRVPVQLPVVFVIAR